MNTKTDPNQLAFDRAIMKTANVRRKRKIMNQDPKKQLVELSNRASRSMIALIDAMCGRGAVKGEELMPIAQLRDQCTQIINLAETVMSSQTDEPPTEIEKKLEKAD